MFDQIPSPVNSSQTSLLSDMRMSQHRRMAFRPRPGNLVPHRASLLASKLHLTVGYAPVHISYFIINV